MMMNAIAMSPPPPMPWMPRNTTSCTNVWATAHSREPMRKITIDTWNNRRRP